MILRYVRPRRATIKGPYIFSRDGITFCIPLGDQRDIPDKYAHKILDEAGDIIEVVKKPARKAGRPAKKKVVQVYEDK